MLPSRVSLTMPLNDTKGTGGGLGEVLPSQVSLTMPLNDRQRDTVLDFFGLACLDDD